MSESAQSLIGCLRHGLVGHSLVMYCAVHLDILVEDPVLCFESKLTFSRNLLVHSFNNNLSAFQSSVAMPSPTRTLVSIDLRRRDDRSTSFRLIVTALRSLLRRSFALLEILPSCRSFEDLLRCSVVRCFAVVVAAVDRSLLIIAPQHGNFRRTSLLIDPVA
jgi:hypothetical protein